MFSAVMTFIYQHPLISGFILYWSSWRYLTKTNQLSHMDKEDENE